MYQVSALKVKNGWILVGSVPIELQYNTIDLKLIENELKLPSNLRSIKARLFKTEFDAIQTYRDYINGGAEYSLRNY